LHFPLFTIYLFTIYQCTFYESPVEIFWQVVVVVVVDTFLDSNTVAEPLI